MTVLGQVSYTDKSNTAAATGMIESVTSRSGEALVTTVPLTIKMNYVLKDCAGETLQHSRPKKQQLTRGENGLRPSPAVPDEQILDLTQGAQTSGPSIC